MNLEIANRLVALRKEQHLSQEALAEKLGISRQAVSKWERAEASPDTDNLIALAKLYHISLDELLKIQEEKYEVDYIQGVAENESGNQDECETDEGISDESAGQMEENAGDEVQIGFHGIHVRGDNGDEVHIGWDGIHVHDSGDEVHIDRHGIYVNGEKAERHLFIRGNEKAEFPIWIITIMVYIVIGICFNLWHPGWLIFFLAPVISTFIYAVRCRNANLFAYPILVTCVFLYAGVVHYKWHPTWVLFLTIPVYYSLVGYFQNRED